MSDALTQRFCPGCDRLVAAYRSRPNHTFHLILTLLTLGLWSIVWLLIAVAGLGSWRCRGCGRRV
jgi:hypothetical protein